MTKSCFDERIELIKRKYDLYYEETEIRFLNSRTEQVEACICDFFKESIHGDVSFQGAGASTLRLLELIKNSGEFDFSIKAIFDKKPCERRLCGYPVYGNDSIQEIRFDYIIVSSFRFRTEMKKELSYTGCAGKIVDIYDILAERGFFFDDSYWNWSDPRLFYLTINYYKNQYIAEYKEKKRKNLLKLISCYLNIRDFVSFRHYVKEYNELFGNGLSSICDDIDEVLSDIKKGLRSKSKRTIAMFWVDQLKYSDINEMPYLKQFGFDNTFFEKCYTENLQTSTTFKMMFSGKHVLDDNAYSIDTITSDNSVVYRELVENGFDFRYIGWGKNNVYFDGISEYSLEKDNCHLPLNAWKMLIDTIDDDNKDHFYLLHSFEVHEHHWCGEMSDALYDVRKATFEEFEKRYRECVEYVDRQLAFYTQLIEEFCELIIMSDHGQELENVYLFDENNVTTEKLKLGRWSDNSLHTVMTIKSNTLGKHRVKGFFSLVDFVEIIRSLMKQEWLVKEKEYTLIQSMPFYSKEGLDKLYASNNLKFGMLVKGVITEKYKYLRYADQSEELYLSCDEDNNVLNEDKYNVVVDELRRMCGEIDYSIFEVYKYRNAKKALEDYIQGGD